MKKHNTTLQDCFIIEPHLFEDERGYFFESFRKDKLEEFIGKKITFVQDNESKSCYGTLRGLHFQHGEYAQAKLVRVVKGAVLDVVVDLRENSPTYKQYFSCILNDENKFQLFVPKGFAHGFVTLSKQAVFSYKCDNYYCPKAERGIIYNDKSLQIDWKIPLEDIIISAKDNQLPTLETILSQ